MFTLADEREVGPGGSGQSKHPRNQGYDPGLSDRCPRDGPHRSGLDPGTTGLPLISIVGETDVHRSRESTGVRSQGPLVPRPGQWRATGGGRAAFAGTFMLQSAGPRVLHAMVMTMSRHDTLPGSPDQCSS